MDHIDSTSSQARMVARSSEAGRAASGPGIVILVIAGAGLAALTTLASTAIRNDLARRPAFAAGAGFAALALLVAAAVVRVRAGEINPAHVH